MFLLLLLLAGALGKRSPVSQDVVGTGHPNLSHVEVFELDRYTVLLGQDDQGTWDWRAWLTSVFESGEEVEGLEEGQGFDAKTRDDAVAEAQAWVAGELGQPLASDAPSSDAKARRGVRMTGDCSRLTVTDIERWIAYASPIVSSYDVEVPSADEVMARTIGDLFADCDLRHGPEIRGKSWHATRDRVQATIAKIVAGELLSVAPVEDVVAARIVGMSAPSVEGAVAQWHTTPGGARRAVVVVPRPDSGAAWWVWAGPRRKWDEAAHVGVAPSVAAGLSDAAAWANENLDGAA